MVEAPRQHYNVTLAILTLAGTAYSLSQTMVVPALPHLQEDLNTSAIWATWVITSFLLVASVATPILGKLGDQYGKERLLLICLAIFCAGCAGAALAWNIWSLIGFRAFQGTAAAIFPLSFAIIRDEFPPEKVATGIGLISAVFGVGGALGILASGLIIDHTSWRFLFVVAGVATLVPLVLVRKFVPESPVKTPSRIDFPGAALLSAGLVALLLALTEGDNWGWTSARTLGLFLVGAMTLVAWILVERRVAEPLVDMHMFAHRPVLVTNVTAIIAGFAMFGSFVLLPKFMETEATRLVNYGFGMSVTEAGLYLMPSALALLIGGPLAGKVGRRIGMKWSLSIGLTMVALASLALGIWNDEPWQILVVMPIQGAGVGFAFAAMATLITETVRVTETGVATGMNTVMRTVGSVIGAQLGTAILGAYLIAGTDIPSLTGYTVTFALMAAVGFVGAVLAIFVTPVRAGRRVPVFATTSNR
jgi:EmrB/QacA subfamily drug resistance transporter